MSDQAEEEEKTVELLKCRVEPHTPGPWVYATNKQGDTIFISVGLGKVDYADGISGSRGKEYLCLCGIGGEADAALVAKAPDLLRELVRMAMYFKSGETRPEALGRIRDAERVITEATLAIDEVNQ